MTGEKGDRKGGDGGGAPLEVVGDPVLEAGGRVDLPLRELLLQAAARDLAQGLHARTHAHPHKRGTHEDQSNRAATSHAAGSDVGDRERV